MAPPAGKSRLQLWILAGLLVGLLGGIAANLLTAGRGPEPAGNDTEAAAGRQPAASGKTPGRARLETAVHEVVRPVGTVFLRLLFMTVLPLVFSSLALGVYGMGSLTALGKVGLKTLVFTVALSGVSVAIGLALVNALRPGTRIEAGERERFLAAARREAQDEAPRIQGAAQAGKRFSPGDLVDLLIPRNPVEAAARAFEGQMLGVLVFALLFGVALRASGSARAVGLVPLLEGLYDVSFWLVGFALKLAPVGVAALVFSVTSVVGLQFLVTLGGYMGTVVLGLLLQLLVVYPLVLKLGARVSPRLFFARIREVMVTAFSTSSSNATLPTTLRVSRERLGVAPRVGDFVLTLGSTLNQNGTALFEGVTILFLAQLYGVPLGLPEQALVVALSVLAGVGTAGIPAGSIPLLVPVLVSVGVPADGIAVILGVDRLLDMCRTVLNVTGDLVVAATIARSEGAIEVPAE